MSCVITVGSVGLRCSSLARLLLHRPISACSFIWTGTSPLTPSHLILLISLLTEHKRLTLRENQPRYSLISNKFITRTTENLKCILEIIIICKNTTGQMWGRIYIYIFLTQIYFLVLHSGCGWQALKTRAKNEQIWTKICFSTLVRFPPDTLRRLGL